MAIDETGAEPTIGRLVADASRELSTLVRSEIALAKSELKISVRAGGIGAALLVVAAFVALLSLILLSIAIAFFLSWTGLDLAWCFLIVFGLYLLVAAVAGLIGVSRLKKVGPPERAIAEAKKTKETLTRAGS